MPDETKAQEYESSISETSSRDGQVIMPFYVICDVSYSMNDDEQALNDAIADVVREIQHDPVIDDLVMLSVITFGDSALTVVPLGAPADISLPRLKIAGSTNYESAFEEFHRSFEQSRAELKGQGVKVYRPCVFFLTDGAPTDRKTYLDVFRKLFAYNPETGVGNQAFPYFIPLGFRDADEKVIQSLAYPDFGPTRGRWFLSRSSNVAQVLKVISKTLANTVVSSGMSARQNLPQIIPPTFQAAPDVQFGDSGGFV